MGVYPKNYDSYQIEKKLGEGSFAVVHLASLKTNSENKVALKVVKVG
jgi:serine/threonine protein kinase